MRFVFVFLIVSILFGLIVDASALVLNNSVVFADGDYFIVFDNLSVDSVVLLDRGLEVSVGGRTLWFHIEGGNLSVEKISSNELVLVVNASSGTVSYLYVSGFRPNRVLVNNLGAKRVSSLEYLAPGSYYMNNTMLVLCAKHHSPVVWRLLVLPAVGGFAAGPLAVEPATTLSTATVSATSTPVFVLNVAPDVLILVAALILAFAALAALSGR